MEDKKISRREFMKYASGALAAGLAAPACVASNVADSVRGTAEGLLDKRSLEGQLSHFEGEFYDMISDGVDHKDFKKLYDMERGNNPTFRTGINEIASNYSNELSTLPEAQKTQTVKRIDDLKANMGTVMDMYVDALVEKDTSIRETGGNGVVQTVYSSNMWFGDKKYNIGGRPEQEPLGVNVSMDFLNKYLENDQMRDIVYKLDHKIDQTTTPKEYKKAWTHVTPDQFARILGTGDKKAGYERTMGPFEMTLGQLTDGNRYNWELSGGRSISLQGVYSDGMKPVSINVSPNVSPKSSYKK